MRRISLLLLAALVTAPVAAAKAPLRWQQQIREADRKRLAGLWSAWTHSLGEAAGAGASGGDSAGQLASLGNLVVPDAALPAPWPAVGRYRCRTITLGVRDGSAPAGATVPAMTRGDAVPCAITEKAGQLWFEATAGPRRVGGRLFADGDRMVFLGSLAMAGEMGVMAYGADGQRDQVGVLRRYADDRWRLELPWPNWQSNLVLIAIEPA